MLSQKANSQLPQLGSAINGVCPTSTRTASQTAAIDWENDCHLNIEDWLSDVTVRLAKFFNIFFK